MILHEEDTIRKLFVKYRKQIEKASWPGWPFDVLLEMCIDRKFIALTNDGYDWIVLLVRVDTPCGLYLNCCLAAGDNVRFTDIDDVLSEYAVAHKAKALTMNVGRRGWERIATGLGWDSLSPVLSKTL